MRGEDGKAFKPNHLRILLDLHLKLISNQNYADKLFSILEKMVPSGINKNNGRPGLELWKIFVLSILRLNLDWDYDRLLNMANNHLIIRQMLGHSDVFDRHEYELQTLKDNFRLLTPEILNEINTFIVECGHGLVKKKKKTNRAIFY